jgi:hypothetical protein
MSRKPRAESPTREAKSQRPSRARPTPRWLMTKEDLDEMARRRCLMVLSVLSGERPVTEVIAETQMSRGTYYQLETKALNAMLLALAPGADGDSSTEAMGTARRIEELEAKVKKLEQEKRRTDRLLFLTRKVVKPGPMTTGAGRPPETRTSRSATPGGRRSSPRSRSRAGKPAATTTPSASSGSTPTTAGAGAC